MAVSRRTDWWRLTGVAVLLALVTLPIALIAAFSLHAATWQWWEPPAEPPAWLTVGAVAVLVGPTMLPGIVVGLVAGLRRWWLLLAAALSALGGVGVSVLATFTIGEAYGPGAAVPGMVGGSLLAVVVAERWGHGGTGAGEAADDGRARATRSREDRLIAGVCGGWARARGRDPRWVRAMLAVVGLGSLVLARPLGLVLAVAYVFAWLTWPLAPDEDPATSPGAGGLRRSQGRR